MRQTFVSMGWAFGDCELDAETYELRRRGSVQHLEPQAFDVLTYLVANRHRVVTKHELMRAVWGDRPVTESALTTRIKEVRRIIGDDGRSQTMIRTMHGRGYRFVAQVRGDTIDSFDNHVRRPPQRSDQVLRHCVASDGVRLAYALIGEGPTIVQDTTPLTDIQYDWDNRAARDWIELLGAGRRLVRYDRRGSGLSQHDAPATSVERMIDDLRDIVDAAELDRFALIGYSIQAAVAVRFAVEHPDRVDRLVLCGCPLVGPLAPGVPQPLRAEYELNVEMFRQGWGSGRERLRRMVAKSLMPDASPSVWEQFATLHQATSGDSLADFLLASSRVDLTEYAPRLTMPTMVVHARGDTMISYSRGAELARLIPDAHLVTLESNSHLLHAGDPGWPRFRAELEAFLAADHEIH